MNRIFLSIVIPCFNETKRLLVLKDSIIEFINNWDNSFEFIIVDDGSSDGTYDLAKKLFSELDPENNNFKFIKLKENQGKGGALQAGVLEAKGKFILTMDADASTHPLQVAKWRDSFKNKEFPVNSILIGDRKHGLSEIRAKSIRYVLGWFYNILVKLITSLDLSDTQCGFKLYPSGIGKVLFNALEEKGWAHDIEILIKAKLNGIQIIPLPVTWNHMDGEKINVFRDGILMAFKTLKIGFKGRFIYKDINLKK